MTTHPRGILDINDVIWSWWQERNDFVYQPMGLTNFDPKAKQVGHYTQVDKTAS